MQKNINLFEEHLNESWKNSDNIAICFLIAYSELLLKDEEKVSNIRYTDIQELKYFLKKSKEDQFSKIVFENKVNAMIDKISLPVIFRTIKNYREVSGKTINSPVDFFLK